MDALFGDFEVWLTGLGAWAYLVAPFVMAAVAVLPVPAEAPAMANGMLFGPVVGSVITWTGAMLGAWFSYEVARSAGRPIAGRFVRDDVLARIDATVEEAGWWGLLALRFIPVAAFTALNWGSGLCGVPRVRFLWTTAIGIAPGAILFTTSGVGLSALWRRSPSLAGALALTVVALAVGWTRRRHRAEAPGA